jgi:hypothetical protein
VVIYGTPPSFPGLGPGEAFKTTEQSNGMLAVMAGGGTELIQDEGPAFTGCFLYRTSLLSG